MIKKVLLVLAVCAFSGCALFSGNEVVSQWDELEKAADVECSIVPKPKFAAKIRDVMVLPGKKVSFINEVTRRNGQVTQVVAAFEDSTELDVERMKMRDFGSNSLILGGVGMSNGSFVAVLQRKSGQVFLELRSIRDNVVRYKSKSTKLAVIDGKIRVTQNGIWMLYHIGGKDVSKEEALTGAAFFGFPKSGSTLRTTLFSRQKFAGNAQLVVRESWKEALVVWEDKRKGKSQFFATELSGTGHVAKPQRVEVPATSEIESWTVTPHEKGFFLAYVDGDSLVGQATLRFSKVFWKGEYVRVVWKREASLENEHISEPLWQEKGNVSVLMVPKWVDGESTVATYRVGADGLEAYKVSGVFSKGSRVTTAFIDPNEKDLHAIVRYRREGAWQFELCRFEDI